MERDSFQGEGSFLAYFSIFSSDLVFLLADFIIGGGSGSITPRNLLLVFLVGRIPNHWRGDLLGSINNDEIFFSILFDCRCIFYTEMMRLNDNAIIWDFFSYFPEVKLVSKLSYI